MTETIIIEIIPSQHCINIKKNFVQPSRAKDGTMPEFVSDQPGEKGTDGPMSKQCQKKGNPPTLRKKIIGQQPRTDKEAQMSPGLDLAFQITFARQFTQEVFVNGTAVPIYFQIFTNFVQRFKRRCCHKARPFNF